MPLEAAQKQNGFHALQGATHMATVPEGSAGADNLAVGMGGGGGGVWLVQGHSRVGSGGGAGSRLEGEDLGGKCLVAKSPIFNLPRSPSLL